MARLTSCVTKENAVNYGKVVYSLGEKWQEWNVELLFHEGIVITGEEKDDRIAINQWLINYNAYVLARN